MAALFELFFLFCVLCVFEAKRSSAQLAMTPPRGWNSYDSFTWIINEEEFLANCQYMADNMPTYEFCVIDYYWYQSSNGVDFAHDQYGRLIPSLDRWPSAANGTGFAAVADAVHKMGLKFGIHIMRGISVNVIEGSTVMGTNVPLSAIALMEESCPWSPGFVSVNISDPAGQLYYDSIYQLYAQWGVDFIKNDCVFGNYVPEQIIAQYISMQKLNYSVTYSLSPGSNEDSYSGLQEERALSIGPFVNMYRSNDDDWDSWNDLSVRFDTAPMYIELGLMGAQGKDGLSWPDLDMLPFGWLSSPGSSIGPYRPCALPESQQIMQMTLWAMARSPLIFGGDMRHMDPFTLSLLTNAEVLDVNSYSTNNSEIWRVNMASVPLSLEQCDESSRFQIWRRDSKGRICSASRFCIVPREETDSVEIMSILEAPEHSWQSFDEGQRIVSWVGKPRCLHYVSREFILTDCELSAIDGSPISVPWNWDENGLLQHTATDLCVSVSNDTTLAWGARSTRSSSVYIAHFNVGNTTQTLTTPFTSVGVPAGSTCQVHDVWTGKVLGVFQDEVSSSLSATSCQLLGLTACSN